MARLLRQQQLDQVTFRELVEGGAIHQSLASTTRRRVKQNLDRHRRTRSSILPRPVPTGTLLAVIYLGSNIQTLQTDRTGEGGRCAVAPCAGVTPTEIAKKLGIGRASVYRVLQDAEGKAA